MSKSNMCRKKPEEGKTYTSQFQTRDGKTRSAAEAWGQAAELDRPGSARPGFNSENPAAATKVDVCLLKLTMSYTHTFL